MNRRQFTGSAAWALLGGAAVTISGCGGGTGSATTASTPPLQDILATLGSNHGHVAVITAAQLGAGGALEIDIRGTSGHTHTVSLTAEEVAAIRAGRLVSKDSSGSSHVHTVTFNG
jgi:hypothetical protein